MGKKLDEVSTYCLLDAVIIFINRDEKNLAKSIAMYIQDNLWDVMENNQNEESND